MTVGVTISYPSDMAVTDAVETAMEEFNYDFQLPKDTNIEVTDTEICGIND